MRRQKWVIYAGVCIAIYAAGVPLLSIGALYYNRTEVGRIQQALQKNDRDTSRLSFVSAEELAREFTIKRRRASIVASVREHIFWVVDKFEKFREGHWYTGDLLLVLRLLQTSLLVLVPTQSLQAAAACGIAISGACALREAQPYRRDSDNETAVIAQYVIFLRFSVVLRYLGVSDPKVLIAMGGILIMATVGIIAHAVWRASDEVKASPSQQSEADEQNQVETTPSMDDNDVSGMLSAGSGGQSPRDVDIEMTAVNTALPDEHHAPKAPSGGTTQWLCVTGPELACGGGGDDEAQT